MRSHTDRHDTILAESLRKSMKMIQSMVVTVPHYFHTRYIYIYIFVPENAGAVLEGSINGVHVHMYSSNMHTPGI